MLAVVVETGTTHGYEVVGRLRAAGLGEVKGGTLYPVLGRLEEQGLLRSRWVEGAGGPGRKLVEATDAGRTELHRRHGEWTRWTSRVATILDGAVQHHAEQTTGRQ